MESIAQIFNRRYSFHIAVLSIIMVLIYYVTFFQFVLNPQINTSNNFQMIIMIVGNILTFMTVWCFIQTVASNPGTIPIGWHHPPDYQQRRKYCLICHRWKPERAHHCSRCQRCTLQMNIHVPHIMNCIGFRNRKYFILFLFYSWISLILFFSLGIHYLVQQFANIANDQIKYGLQRTILHIIVVFIELIFILFDSPILIMHIILLSKNQTIVQNLYARIQQRESNRYDVGFIQNFQQGFGSNCLLWAIPISHESYQTVDGLTWPKKE